MGSTDRSRSLATNATGSTDPLGLASWRLGGSNPTERRAFDDALRNDDRPLLCALAANLLERDRTTARDDDRPVASWRLGGSNPTERRAFDDAVRNEDRDIL